MKSREDKRFEAACVILPEAINMLRKIGATFDETSRRKAAQMSRAAADALLAELDRTAPKEQASERAMPSVEQFLKDFNAGHFTEQDFPFNKVNLNKIIQYLGLKSEKEGK